MPRRPNRTLAVMLGVLTTIMVGWVLHVGAGILQPLVIALLLASMLQPIVRLLGEVEDPARADRHPDRHAAVLRHVPGRHDLLRGGSQLPAAKPQAGAGGSGPARRGEADPLGEAAGEHPHGDRRDQAAGTR